MQITHIHTPTIHNYFCDDPHRDCCFIGTNADGTTAYGFDYCQEASERCTVNKTLMDDDLDTYRVLLPPVAELAGRSSCLCCYFGFNCSSTNKPIGCTITAGLPCPTSEKN
jgi:hypothetical protein